MIKLRKLFRQLEKCEIEKERYRRQKEHYKEFLPVFHEVSNKLTDIQIKYLQLAIKERLGIKGEEND